MHQKEQLKSSTSSTANKKSKRSLLTNESSLTVTGERSYKNTPTTQKKNGVIIGDSIPKGINTRLLNKKVCST